MKRQNKKTYKSFPPKKTGKKPIKFPEDRIYSNIDEAAKNCRKIYFIYLTLLAYALLTAATTSSDQLIFGEKVNLPFIQTTVSSHLFFILTPFMAIGLFIYIQLYLRKVNQLIKYSIEECQSNNQNQKDQKCYLQRYGECNISTICEGHRSRLYPWMLIFSRWSEGFIGWAQENFAKFSLWWLLPILLMVFSVLIVKKHEYLSSYILLFLTLLGSFFVIACWFSSQRNEPNKKCSEKPGDKNEKVFTTAVTPEEKFSLRNRYSGIITVQAAILAIYRKYIGCITLFLIVIFFAALSDTIINKAHEGFLWSENGNWSDDIDFRTEYLRNLVFVDLSQKDLVNKQKDSQNSEFHFWLNLENARLEGANLASTILTNANLNNSRLKNARLVKAKLDRASLQEANLNYANLTAASLEDAILYNAQLQDSDLTMANLKSANLSRTNFSRADLSGANLSGANLRGAMLIEADLANANLRGAKLGNANLKKTNLQGADLLNADLRAVKEITRGQIQKATNWKLAIYSKEFCQDLGLPKDHNQRGKDRIFIGYDLREGLLGKADLSGVNFLGAKFQDADLRMVNFCAANLYKADLKNAKLEGANLKNAQLGGANLREANLRGADLFQANLKGTDLLFADLRQAKNVKKGQLREAINWKIGLYSEDIITILDLEPDHNKRIIKKHFADCNYLHGANLRIVDLSGANLRGADLQKADLHQTILKDADLLFADLRQIKNIEVSKLQEAKNWRLAYYSPDLINSLKLPQNHNERIEKKDFSENEYHLQKAMLQGARLKGANFKNSKLHGANLRGATLREADLGGADLDGADLLDADFRMAKNISLSQLKKAKNWRLALYTSELFKSLGLPQNHNQRVEKKDFSGDDYDLQEAMLQEAKLEGADLKKSNLRGVNLRRAILRGADLDEADLDGANLLYADLRQAKNISVNKIKKAKNWRLAFYSPELIKNLELPQNHNERIEKKNLSGYDLRGAELSEADLSDADLRETDLQKADLHQTILKDADLLFADLRQIKNIEVSKLQEAKNWRLAYYSPDLINSLKLPQNHNERIEKKDFSENEYDLREAELSDADLKESKLSGVNLREAILQRADLGGADLDGAKLLFSDLRQAKNISVSQLHQAMSWQLALYSSELIKNLELPRNHNERVKKKDLSGYNLQEADLSEADLKDSNLRKTILRRANLKEADLDGANLLFADLRQAKNIDANQIKKAKNWRLALYSPELIQKLDLPQNQTERVEEKKFIGDNLEGADLSEADLRAANLLETNLERAKLRNTNLEQADLRKAKLNYADLGGAILYRANLRGANLLKTDLTNTNLRGVDLRDILYSTYEQFSNVETLFQAKIDSGLEGQLKNNYPNLFKKPSK